MPNLLLGTSLNREIEFRTRHGISLIESEKYILGTTTFACMRSSTMVRFMVTVLVTSY